MKYLHIALLFSVFFSMPSLGVCTERDDFGFRAAAGAVQGIGSSLTPELSFYADFYLLSQTTRMTFGFSLMRLNDGDLPLISVQSIGLEQNFPIGMNRIFIGTAFNKAYMEFDTENFDPDKGVTFHAGYKHRVKRFHDVVIWVGHQYQPLQQRRTKPGFPLDERTIFARLGWEWYF